ncbi:unnamed protein product [Adineta steineri]|uniref:Uncharacterized protein n=1 Tax=Adineta steineri TaxID=433720 RepID=A0A816D356_9BILA|nr:unnamed protein product [Adineta steineri]CAF1629731.1 unnamed protein product [Adineta steineri]
MTDEDKYSAKSKSLNCDEQPMGLEKATPITKMERKDSTTLTSIDSPIRHRSLNIIDKFRKIRRDSLKLNDGHKKTFEENDHNALHMPKLFPTLSLLGRPTLTTSMDLSSISLEDRRLKGILKKSVQTSSCSDLTKELLKNHNFLQRHDSVNEHDRIKTDRETSVQFLSVNSDNGNQDSRPSSPKGSKHVTFDEEVSEDRYPPMELSFSPTEPLSFSEIEDSNAVHRKDSLQLRSMPSRKT